MVQIYVDGDACPVKEEIMRVAERRQTPVIMVANQWLRYAREDLVTMVIVEAGADAADDWIAEHIGPGDVAVTADIPLAARCLEKGALVLGPTGKEFDANGIGMALAMRDLNSHLRETGALQAGGGSFGKTQRAEFLQALENLLQRAARS